MTDTTVYIDEETATLIDNYSKQYPIPPSRSAVVKIAVQEFCKKVK